jgi:hypothetical protein
MATALSIVNATLRKIGVRNPTATNQNEGLERLNDLLTSWSANGANIFYEATETFTLTISQNTYTIGTGGDLNTSRPQQIMIAYIRDSNNIDYGMDIVQPIRYHEEPVKATEGRPSTLYYSMEYPLGKVYLQPTPNAAETLVTVSRKPLSEISTLATTVSLPNEYRLALINNLLLELCGDYGYEPSINDQRVAISSKKQLVRANARPIIMDIESPLRDDIYSDINLGE